MKKIKENFKKAKKRVKDFFVKRDEEIKIENERETKLVGFRLLEVVVLISIATIIGVFSGSFLTYNFVKGNDKIDKSSSTYINEFEEAYQNVLDNYYEDVDKGKLIDAAINGMLSTLDGYTSYINADETEQFNERMEGEYQGIGIEFTTATGYVHTITGVMEGSPALEAGLIKGDTIVKVDALDASTKTGTEIASYIKGKNISEITMIVKRDGKEVTINIKKSLIQLPSVTKRTFDKNGKKVGYVSVSLFANNTYSQFKTAVTALESEGITSLVIDVRNNSGGYLHAADDMLELFLSKGDIMYKMQDKTGTIPFDDKTDEKRTYLVVLLINGYSASASEVIAAAFNEVYGAQLVGTTSYGKGTVQQPSDLTNGGMIKVTTDKWLTPKGNWIDKVGLKPTTEVELGDAYITNPTDENDTQLQKALELLAK